MIFPLTQLFAPNRQKVNRVNPVFYESNNSILLANAGQEK
jgi:hypothetical protein